MKVSVVIPTYNRGHVVGRALDSVLAQRYDDVEAIVVDDGSTDGTAERVRPRADGRRVRYLHRPHAGVAATRNAGVLAATGELVSFLDSDDYWKPEKLEHEVAFLDRHSDVHAVFSDLEKYDGEVFVPSFMRESPLFSDWLADASYPDGVVLPERAMYLYLLQECFVKTSALTLRRDAFVRAGGFEETLSSSEDWEFLLRFAKWARFGYIDRPLAVICLSRDSLHRIDQPRGETAMLRVLAREREAVNGDAEALAAVQRGLRERIKQLAWYYDEVGRPLRAARVYLRGFRITRDPALLVRAFGVWVPPTVRQRVVGTLRRVVPRRRAAARAIAVGPSAGRGRQAVDGRPSAGRRPVGSIL
jgi:hypothetical protein